MKGGIHFYLAGAVILLTLAGCTRGMSFAAREESYGAAEDVDDDLSSDTSEASFGPDDPGVTLITADEGGNIDRYDSMFFGPESDTTRWAIDGYCNSACTMVLGTGRVCATPRAQFGFHAGYYKLFVFWKVINPKLTHPALSRPCEELGRCPSCNGSDHDDHDAPTRGGDLRVQLPTTRSWEVRNSNAAPNFYFVIF